MPAEVPGADRVVLGAAFTLVFRQGRAPPSCPVPDEADLVSRIREMVPGASPDTCREAISMVRKLSRDALVVCDGYRYGVYGRGPDAQKAAIRTLAAKNPDFSEIEYMTAFSTGMMWTAF